MNDFIIDIQGFVFRGKPMVLKAVNVLECDGGVGTDKTYSFELFPNKPKWQLTDSEVTTVKWAERYHGYRYNGGFCTLNKVRQKIYRLIPAGANVYVNGVLKARVLEDNFDFARRNITLWTTTKRLYEKRPKFVDSLMILSELKHRYDYELATSFCTHVY